MSTNTLPAISSLWRHDDPVASQNAFSSLLQAAESCGDSGYVVSLLTQIARAQGLQRNYEAANASLDRARRLLDASNPQETRSAMVSYLLERGRIYRASGYEDRAEDYFLEAYELALGGGESAAAIDAAHMLALLSSGPVAIDWLHKALHHAGLGLDGLVRRWQAPLYELLGREQAEQGDTETALDSFRSAERFRGAFAQHVSVGVLDCSGSSCACPEHVSDGSLLVLPD